MLFSLGANASLLVAEEASQHEHLAQADGEQQRRFAHRPVVDALMDVLRPDAVVRLPQAVARLRLRHHLQDLVDGEASGLQLCAWRFYQTQKGFTEWIGGGILDGSTFFGFKNIWVICFLNNNQRLAFINGLLLPLKCQ